MYFLRLPWLPLYVIVDVCCCVLVCVVTVVIVVVAVVGLTVAFSLMCLLRSFKISPRRSLACGLYSGKLTERVSSDFGVGRSFLNCF